MPLTHLIMTPWVAELRGLEAWRRDEAASTRTGIHLCRGVCERALSLLTLISLHPFALHFHAIFSPYRNDSIFPRIILDDVKPFVVFPLYSYNPFVQCPFSR